MMNGRMERMLQVLGHRQPYLTVVLENVFDPHNISAVMRTCDSVGIGEIFVLNTRLPPHEHWGFRSSSGAWKWVKVHQYEDFHECLQVLKQRFQRLLAAHAGPQAESLYKQDFTSPVALVFGNEQEGCTPEMLAACDGQVMIPQVGMVQSLNISVACGVMLYEAYRQKMMAGHYDAPALDPEQIRSIMNEWNDPIQVRKLKQRKP